MEEVVVYAKAFQELRNPYTGEPFKVYMWCGGSAEPMFRAERMYTTNDVFPTLAEALEAWSRKDGVSYTVPEGEPPVCRYTGKPLSVCQTSEGFSLAGGFDPCRYWRRDEFLYWASMRGGRAVRPVPQPRSRATPVSRTERSVPRLADVREERARASMEQAALDAGARIADRFCETSPTVSMHVKAAPSRKKARAARHG